MSHATSAGSPGGRGGLLRRLEVELFRLLTRLYPGRFRARYGPEILAFFHAERARARHRGIAGGLRFWRYTLGDLSLAVLRGRTRSIPSSPLMLLSNLSRHLKLSVRALRRQPAFAATVIVTLTVGIAATLVVFSLVDAALLQAIPFRDGDRMVFVQGTTTVDRNDVHGASLQEVREWAADAGGFEALAAVGTTNVNLGLEDGVRQVPMEIVTPAYFDVVAVQPLLGRVFDEEDDRVPNGHPVALIHEQLWEEQFGGDPAVIGKVVRLNDMPFTVVGVLPRRFEGVNLNTRVWVPMMMASVAGRDIDRLGWADRWLAAIGRLSDGVSIEAAQAEVDAVARELARQHPATNEGRTGSLTPARSIYLGTSGDMLLVLLVGSGVLLLVATVNAAGLLTVKSATHRDEHAMCLALGARPGSVAARALVDALVLAALAAGASWLLARAALSYLLANLPSGALPPFVDPRLGAGTLLFASGVVVVAALLSGLLPALQSSRGDLTQALRSVRTSAPGGSKSPRRSPQQLLVIAEVAIALVLLVGTGLMGRTLLQKLAVPRGFSVDGLSVVRVRMSGERYADGAALVGFAERARQHLLEMPGIEDATYSSDVPLRGDSSASIVAPDPTRPRDGVRFYRHRVAPGFRELLGIELLRGRDLTEDDIDGAPVVVQVSRELADRFLGGVGAAVGRSLLLFPGFGDVPATVVGVVGGVRWRDLTSDITAGEDDPDVYMSYAQFRTGVIELTYRTAPGVEPSFPEIREALRDVDPNVPAYQPASLAAQLRLQTAGDRLTVAILAVFGAAALLLAGIGVYGALASAVAHRRREIAIRMALGATVSTLRGSVLAQGTRLAALGAAVGAVLAVLLSRALSGLLFGVSSLDAATYGTVVALLLAVAVLATWLPAVRATRVEPQSALRS